MIYTIGTSTRSLGEFVMELDRRQVTHLVDVRSHPYSRYSWFNRDQIEKWCLVQARLYRWEGRILGGRSEMPIDHPDYIEALSRLIDSAGRENLAVFCAEGDPSHCHRTWNIAASLLVRWGLVAKNILRDGREEDVTTTLPRVPSTHVDPALHDALKTLLAGWGGPEMLNL